MNLLEKEHQERIKHEQEHIKKGQKIAKLLNLRKNKKGRYNTSWGDKTELGLYLTIKRIIEEV